MVIGVDLVLVAYLLLAVFWMVAGWQNLLAIMPGTQDTATERLFLIFVTLFVAVTWIVSIPALIIWERSRRD